MQIATLIKTGKQVEILTVNGGWTTIRTEDGTTAKVRNGALGAATTIDEKTAPITAKAAKARRARLAHDGDRAAREVPAERPVQRKKEIDINERKNGVVDSLYLPQYQAAVVVRTDGSRARVLDCGDQIAHELRRMTLAEIYKYAAQLENVTPAHLQERFEHLNPGMQRMSLGNIIRRIERQVAKAQA